MRWRREPEAAGEMGWKMQRVDRRERISLEEFRAEYSGPGRPVVFTNLFAGQRLDGIRTAEAFRTAFGNMPIWTFESYDDNQRRLMLSLLFSRGEQTDVKPFEQLTTVAEYMDVIARDPTYNYLCSESPQELWPEDFANAFEFPPYCEQAQGPLSDRAIELWLGRGGYITHMHYDADGRDNLLHQVFGRKRFILAPPSSASRIGCVLNKGIMSPEGLSDRDRQDWVSYIQGVEVDLNPGETLFIPALWWHYAEYVTTSFSIVMRHNRNDFVRAFYDNVQPNYKSQLIIDKFRNADQIEPAWQEVFARFSSLFEKTYTDAGSRHQAVQALVDEVYASMSNSEAHPPMLTPIMSWGVQLMEGMLGQADNFKALRFKGDEQPHAELIAEPA
jgi:hypothetical protein